MARFDEAYRTSVKRIDEVHNKLGRESRRYIGGYSDLVAGETPAIGASAPLGQARREALEMLRKTVIKAALLDMDIALDVCIEASKGLAVAAHEVKSLAEQTARAATEISQQVGEIQAATGTSSVTATIETVTTDAAETSAAATQVLTSAGALARQSEQLRTDIDRFLATVRAA